MKVHKEMLDRWKKYASLYLHERGFSLDDITNHAQAWKIAHILEIPKEAYDIDNSINDDHIETALRRIFPNL